MGRRDHLGKNSIPGSGGVVCLIFWSVIRRYELKEMIRQFKSSFGTDPFMYFVESRRTSVVIVVQTYMNSEERVSDVHCEDRQNAGGVNCLMGLGILFVGLV